MPASNPSPCPSRQRWPLYQPASGRLRTFEAQYCAALWGDNAMTPPVWAGFPLAWTGIPPWMTGENGEDRCGFC
jgi:hypothetical protein